MYSEVPDSYAVGIRCGGGGGCQARRLPDGTNKQNGFLRDDGQATAEVLQADVCDVHPIDQDAPSCWVY